MSAPAFRPRGRHRAASSRRRSFIALALAPLVGLTGAAVALLPATAAPGDYAYAESRFLSGSLLLDGVSLDDIAALGGEQAELSGNPGPVTNTGDLDVTALNALSLTIPGGASVLLGDFLQLGAVNQHAHAEEYGVSRAATGAVSDSGVVDTSGSGSYPANATLSLQELLGASFTSEIADLELDLGAISATAEQDAGAGTQSRGYSIASGTLSFQSTTLGTVDDLLVGTDGVADTVDAAVAALAGADGSLAIALEGLLGIGTIAGSSDVSIAITSDVDGALEALLDVGVSDSAVTLDLRTGEVSVDLDQLLTEELGHGLDNLDPNEEILSSAVLSAITARLSALLVGDPGDAADLGLVGDVQDALTTSLEAATLDVDVDICLLTAAIGGACLTGATVSIVDQTLGDIVDGSATGSVSVVIAGLSVTVSVVDLISALAAPIVGGLFDGSTGVVATVGASLSPALRGLIDTLDPVLGALTGVVSVQGNVREQGAAGAGSIREVALRVTVGDLLGAGGVATLDLARAEVGANVAGAYTPTLDASSPVEAGRDSALVSSGWPADTDVQVRLFDGASPVGSAVTITTDGTGAFPAAAVLPIGAGVTPGAYDVVATDGLATASDTILVIAPYTPTLDAASPVEAAAESALTSSGWPALTDVTVQVYDGITPIGSPIVVTTDGSGAFPAGTTITAPGAPGSYTVEGDDGDGHSASDTLDVVAASDPVLVVTDPVEAGDDAPLTSSGWPPNTDVTVQLSDEFDTPIGSPLVVTTDGSGEFPPGTAIPVPPGTAPGTYTAEATDGTDTASDDFTVFAFTPVLDASSPVEAGRDSALASSGWPANTDVEVQLYDSGDSPVGASVTVTTDTTGAFPGGTVLPIGAGVTPGSYTVGADDGLGHMATDAIEVVAPYTPTLDADSPVEAGSESALTSSGWPANTDVTVQVYDGATPIGSPIVVTTDGVGDFPAGTTITAPGAPGSYTVEADDGDGHTASDTLDVTAPASPVIVVTDPVEEGQQAPLSSSGWPADTDVTVQLYDVLDNPVGGPLVVRTDGTGAFPPGTSILVPEGTVPGTYTADATDGSDTASDDFLVFAYSPVIDASSPVAAGDESALVSTGWPAADDVTVQLSNAGGDIGAPVVITTDGTGAFPAGSVLPIGAGVLPGSYTVTATDGEGRTTADSIEVVAASVPIATVLNEEVVAGATQSVTGTGFAPFELVAGSVSPSGLDLGIQAADAAGTVVFTWTIPVDDDLGDYTVTLTGATSGAASDDFAVIDAGVGGDGGGGGTGGDGDGDGDGVGGDGGLASTGVDIRTWIALAALALMLGLIGTAIPALRRREERAEA